MPCTDNIVKVDLRTVSFEIPPNKAGHTHTFLSQKSSHHLHVFLTQADINRSAVKVAAASQLRLSTLQILTKDSVTVSVDGVVYLRIQCPISSVANVHNAHWSTWLLAQTTLRNVLGTKNLAELLSDREGISLSMQVRRKP